MKEKGILFSAPMVRAILAGKKTVTRRLASWPILGPSDGAKRRVYGSADLERERAAILACCPHGRPGNRLWVRETWRYAGFTEDGYPFIRCRADDTKHLCERVDPAWSDRLTDIWAKLSQPANFGIDGTAADRVWRPAIFMPRWASRITPEVADVRLERLQDISEEDAKAEGPLFAIDEEQTVLFPELTDERNTGCYACAGDPHGIAELCHPALRGRGRPFACWFATLWDSINGERAPWSSNPWVWVVSFRVVEPEARR